MKTFNCFLLILCILSSGIAYAGLGDGLVAYYPMNGTAKDVTGHGYNGIVHGVTATTDRFGNANQAFRFNGINDYIDLGTSLDIPSWPDYAVSVWFLNDGNGSPSCGFGTGYGEKILDKTVYWHDFYINVCPAGDYDQPVSPPKSVSPFFAKPDGTSKSPSGAKNWRQLCLRRPGTSCVRYGLRCARRHSSHND